MPGWSFRSCSAAPSQKGHVSLVWVPLACFSAHVFTRNFSRTSPTTVYFQCHLPLWAWFSSKDTRVWEKELFHKNLELSCRHRQEGFSLCICGRDGACELGQRRAPGGCSPPNPAAAPKAFPGPPASLPRGLFSSRPPVPRFLNSAPTLIPSHQSPDGPETETALQTVPVPPEILANDYRVTQWLARGHWLHTRPRASILDPRATLLCCALSGQLSRPFPAAAGRAAPRRCVGVEQLGRDSAHRTRWEEELLWEKGAMAQVAVALRRGGQRGGRVAPVLPDSGPLCSQYCLKDALTSFNLWWQLSSCRGA